MTLKPDLDEARRFLTMLDPEATEFTFQTYDDKEGRGDPSLIRVLNGTFDEHAAELTRLNRLGAAIHVTINRTNLHGRKAEDIVGIRAIWQDADGKGEASTFPLKPSIVNGTSTGRVHRYWLCKGLTVEEHRGVMEGLDVLYGTDPNTKDISRVLRLPGF
jgi:RepB DNA-primase N-terminal domain